MSGEFVREKIGKIFVDLTAKLYGGKITKNGENNPDLGNPDILNWERNQAYESKASISSDHHKISPKQVEHYQELLTSEFPLTNPEVYYFLWQHKKRGISKLPKNKITRNLIKGINKLLIVSFDIIEAGTTVWETTGQNSWGETYMFRSSERSNLTNNPQEELTRMDLNPENYHVTYETIPKNRYAYKRLYLPQFTITSIIKNNLRGLERK